MAKKLAAKRTTKGKSESDRDDRDQLEKTIAAYQATFDEINKFVALIDDEESEIARLKERVQKKRDEYEAAKRELTEAEQLREGAKHGLYRYLRPGVQIMPLFDRMEPADEARHGEGAASWRSEPISALRLSLPNQMLLMDADIILIGQLQDAMQNDPDDWFEGIRGLTAPIAYAIADKLADFIRNWEGK